MTTTGKFGSASAILLVDGYNVLSNKVQGSHYKNEALNEKTTGQGDSWEESTPVGVSKLEFGQDGAFWYTTTGLIHDMLATSVYGLTPQSNKRVVVFGVAGNSIGQPISCIEGVYTNEYEVVATVGKLQRANVKHEVSGQIDEGVIVHALGAETAAGNTEATSVDNTTVPQRTIAITSNSQANPTVLTTPTPHGLTTGDTVLISGVTGSSPTIAGERTVTVISTTTFSVPVDTSAGSAGTGGSFLRGKTQGGAIAYLEVTALTLGGYTDALITIRTSTDNITFVDLVAFAVVTTAPSAQRVTVAGSVRRYLAQSVAFDGAGSGPSITYLAGVARG